MSVKILDQNMEVKMKEKKNKIFINKLINHLMKSGKKSYATNIIYNNGFFLARYLNKSLYNIYSEIFIRLRPFIEIRKVRVRRTTYMVPFPTNSMRQYYLVSNWLLETLRNDKRKINFNIKFREEIIKILLNQNSNTLEKKKDLYKKAEKSRSFAHFRWY